MTFRPCFGHYQVNGKNDGRYIYVWIYENGVKELDPKP